MFVLGPLKNDIGHEKSQMTSENEISVIKKE